MKEPSFDVKSSGPTPDYFESLPGVQAVRKRLYNPELRTTTSQSAWEKTLPFIEANIGILEQEIGSAAFSVHLHGSMLIGVGGSPKESDIDIIIFSDGFPNRNSESFIPEEEPVFEFAKKSDARGALGHRVDGFVVEYNGLLQDIINACKKITKGEELTHEEKISLYYAATLFGSPVMTERIPGQEAKFKNNILKTVLENPGGDIIWKAIGEYFNYYIVNYEHNAIDDGNLAKHRARISQAINRVMARRNIDLGKTERVKKHLQNQRKTVQLPSFDDITTLREKLEDR